MADEFAKGLGILVGAGLVWMVLAGWYNTPGFEQAQLIAATTGGSSVFDQLANGLKEAAFWFMIVGTLTFWVFIPAVREGRQALE